MRDKTKYSTLFRVKNCTEGNLITEKLDRKAINCITGIDEVKP